MSHPPSPKQNTSTKDSHGHASSQLLHSSRIDPSAAASSATIGSPTPTLAPPHVRLLSGPRIQDVGPGYSAHPSTSYTTQPPYLNTILSQSATNSPSFAASGSSQPQVGRKTKAHVASACINCKKAHLSCDVARPCARCIASGKQDTCFDVQHKKRGRPRLREEPEVHGERVIDRPRRDSFPAISTTQVEMLPQPRTRTRPARASSFRPIHSQLNQEAPGWPTPGHDPVLTTPHYVQSRPSPAEVSHSIPTAFVDLDLRIMKANLPFEEVMLSGYPVGGRSLAEIVRMSDASTFANLKSRLRAERESKDPSFMPPIITGSLDTSLPDMTEAQIERCTASFEDHTYAMTPLRDTTQTFPARIRLAKSRIYFAVVTLPTVVLAAPGMRPALPRPTEADVSTVTSSPLAPVAPESHSFLQRIMDPGPQETSSQTYTDTPATRVTSDHPIPNPRLDATRLYSTEGRARPSSMPLVQPLSQIPEPSVFYSPQHRPLSTGPPATFHAPSDAIQLPPILPRATTTATPAPATSVPGTLAPDASSLGPTAAPSRSVSPSPRKRRRMSIGNVLHR